MSKSMSFFPERLRLYEEGLSDSEIAREIGVAKTTISGWRWRRKLPPNGGERGRQKIHIPKGDLERMYWEEGMTQTEIGEELGVSEYVVSDRMREYGIPSRYPGRRTKEHQHRAEVAKSKLPVPKVISRGPLSLIRCLSENPLFVRQLSEIMESSQPTRRWLPKLESEGLVRFNVESGRKYVELTEKGREVLDKLEQLMESLRG